MAAKDYYSILGVSKNATADEIRKAFINRSRVVHPDRFDSTKQPNDWRQANEMMKELNEAYNTLKDPELRTKYDASLDIGKKPQEDKQQTSAQEEPRAQPKTQAKPQPQKGATIIYFQDLPQDKKAFILSKQKNENSSECYKVKIESNLPKYLLSTGILFGFFILYGMSHDSRWSSSGTFFIFAASCIGSVIFFRKVHWLYNWHKSDLKCFYYVTPLYFIKTYFNEIRYWWAWDTANIKTTDHYRNGSYQNTSVELEFKDTKETIVFSSQAEWLKFYHAMKEMEEARLKAASHQDWAWFEQRGFFHGIVGKNNQAINETKHQQRKKAYFLYGSAIIIAAILFGILYQVNQEYSSSAINRYASSQPEPLTSEPPPTPHPRNTFDKPIKPLPKNGYVIRYSKENPIAPLRIVTQSGSHYFVKIVDHATSAPVVAVFVRSGNSVEIEVPLGTFAIKYATGQNWYGTKYLFGPETQVNMAEKAFEFRVEGEKVMGFTIELILQQGGNLHTKKIDIDEF